MSKFSWIRRQLFPGRRVLIDVAEARVVDLDVFTEAGLRVVFDAAPVSLWIEDFSGVKALIDEARAAGATSFAGHVATHPSFVDDAIAAIKVLHVNEFTLRLYRASSVDEFVRRSGEVLRGEARIGFTHELAALWEGVHSIETESVNYALDGTPIDVLVRRSGVPGHEDDWSRVLVSVVDISDRKDTERRLALSEARAVAMFEHSPVALMIEDFSAVRVAFDELRASGVRDIRDHLDRHPEFVRECMSLIEMVDVNQRALEIYRAPSKLALISHVNKIFRDKMEVHFRRDIELMWGGTLGQETEGINYTLTGEPIDIHLQWTVLPGHEERWDRALVSITDITARKRVDEYMHYLGTHDTLTGLFNRTYFDEQVRRLQSEPDQLASLLIGDLNGLKQINDLYGHTAGDLLIRRAGEVLIEATEGGDVAARIGGDEFAVLLPGRDEFAVAALAQRIEKLIDVNNRFHDARPLQMAIGCATMQPGITFGEAFKLADRRMYECKAAPVTPVPGVAVA